MPGPTTPNVSVEQHLFPHDHLGANFANLHKLITSPSKLAAAVKLASDEAHAANFTVAKPVADEALKVYNAVIADGRFINDFKSDPDGVAKKLNLTLSPAAVQAVKTASGFRGAAASDGVELVAVAVIVLVLAHNPNQRVVVDQSGALKL
ncbi:hypothetical protein [Cupriavidus sp. 8B]